MSKFCPIFRNQTQQVWFRKFHLMAWYWRLHIVRHSASRSLPSDDSCRQFSLRNPDTKLTDFPPGNVVCLLNSAVRIFNYLFTVRLDRLRSHHYQVKFLCLNYNLSWPNRLALVCTPAQQHITGRALQHSGHRWLDGWTSPPLANHYQHTRAQFELQK